MVKRWACWSLAASLLLLVCSVMAAGGTTMSADEGPALQRLYSSIGASKYIPSGPDDFLQCDKWMGLTCDGGHVIQLRLPAAGLVGQFPDDIFIKLRTLQVIDLTGNPGITGALPFSIGILSDLKTLGMDGCSLTNFSAELALPPSLGNLKNLVTLGMSGNRLTGRIPEALGGLEKVYWLDISNNSLSGGIPDSFTGLHNVGHFHFQQNRLTGSIPAQLFALKKAKHFLFANNLLSGTLRANFSMDPGEEVPDAGGSYMKREKFAGSLDAGGSSLSILDLGNNSFSGPLPMELRLATNLTQLELAGNNFSGEFPAEVAASLSALFLVDVSKNSLSGSLPVFSSKNLQAILLAYNNLSGPIPDAYASLPALSELHLEGNGLEGHVPDALGDAQTQTGLLFVNLQQNKLTIPAPRALTSRPEIFAFLADNPLCKGWEVLGFCTPRPNAHPEQTEGVYDVASRCPAKPQCDKGAFPNPTLAGSSQQPLCSCAVPFVVRLDLLQHPVPLNDTSAMKLEEVLGKLFASVGPGGAFVKSWQVLSPFSARPVVISITSWWFPREGAGPVLSPADRDNISSSFGTHQVALTKPFATFKFQGASLPASSVAHGLSNPKP